MGSMNKERLNEVKDSRDKTRKKKQKKTHGSLFFIIISCTYFYKINFMRR